MVPHPRVDLLAKFFWKIKSISDDNISKSSIVLIGPLKHIIEYLLVLRHEEIHLVNHYYLVLLYFGD